MQTESQFESFQDNIRVITLSIISVVLILTVTFIMKTYYDEESSIISDLHIEATRIEKILSDDLTYTTSVIEMLTKQIQKRPEDYEHIRDILKYYRINPHVSNIFGWLYFAWIDKNLTMKVNNLKTESYKQIDLSSRNYINISKLLPNKVFYGLEHEDILAKKSSLISIIGVQDQGIYIGSLIASFDIDILVNRINERKKNDYTNFAIIDHRLGVVLKSKDVISKVGIKDKTVISNNLTNILKRIDFYSENPREFSYINMLSGLNYYVRKVKDQPFVLLVNIDHTEIQGKILRKVLLKFAEISIYTFLFLAMVISVYRRETWLREKAEKSSQIATKAVQAKTDFLAYTAHEIRSPLGFILTSSEIMQKKLFGEIPESYNQYVDGINQNSHLILEFINDILDESYIAEGNFKVINKIADVNEIITRAISNNATRFSERKIHIKYANNPGLPKLICDARRMLQSLNNIISNSIKYSYDNTEINITTGIKNKKFFITIADQGVGMSEEDIKIALTKYGTVKNKKSSTIESCGLGLSIVKKLIEAHDGELIVASKIDEGTIVTILFPEYKIIL